MTQTYKWTGLHKVIDSFQPTWMLEWNFRPNIVVYSLWNQVLSTLWLCWVTASLMTKSRMTSRHMHHIYFPTGRKQRLKKDAFSQFRYTSWKLKSSDTLLQNSEICSCRGFGFNSQFPHSGSQKYVSLITMPSSDI